MRLATAWGQKVEIAIASRNEAIKTRPDKDRCLHWSVLVVAAYVRAEPGAHPAHSMRVGSQRVLGRSYFKSQIAWQLGRLTCLGVDRVGPDLNIAKPVSRGQD